MALGTLMPDHNTIADFRKDNGPELRQVFTRFVELCRELGLLTTPSIAIDGSKFKAVNNRDRNFTRGKVGGGVHSRKRALRAISANSTRPTGRNRRRRLRPRRSISRRSSRSSTGR